MLFIPQDLMELLNANGTECSLVLFYTTWCQFSANLAPHFNALPRAFPTMHFLALDASQHSRLAKILYCSHAEMYSMLFLYISYVLLLSQSVNALWNGGCPQYTFISRCQTDGQIQPNRKNIRNSYIFHNQPDRCVIHFCVLTKNCPSFFMLIRKNTAFIVLFLACVMP